MTLKAILAQRNANVSVTASTGTAVQPVMWSLAGATFQESMLNTYADVFKVHKAKLSPELGRLVTAINNGKISVEQAAIEFHSVMYAIVGY